MKCKNCKAKVKKEDLVIRGINYFCGEACAIDYAHEQLEKIKKGEIKQINKQQKPIKSVSSKNKNTPARFTKEIKAKILIRDKQCIFCKNKAISDYHHVYFGTQSNRTETRNNVDQGVGVCRDCHNEIHSCSKGEGKRQEAINYLINNYK